MTLRYRPELDGLRAVAVAMVLVHHVFQPRRFVGFIGVDIFFALSGYLITTILLAEHRRTGRLAFGRFYQRRLLRLYPALLAVLVLIFPLYHWIAPGGGAVAQAKRTLVAATYTSNLYMTYRHQWLGPLAHTWSLALEEQYYLVWPLLLVLSLRFGLRGLRLAAIFTLIAATSGVLSVRDYVFGASVFPVQTTCLGLFAGSALALVLAGESRVRRVLAHPGCALAGTALLASELVAFSLTGAIPDGGYVVASVAATVLLIGSMTEVTAGLPRQLLSLRPAVALGRISYGVYLWHYPLVLLVARQWGGWSPWARLALVAPLTIAIGQLSYVYVETPFLRMKNRIGRGTSDPTPVVPEGDDIDDAPLTDGDTPRRSARTRRAAFRYS